MSRKPSLDLKGRFNPSPSNAIAFTPSHELNGPFRAIDCLYDSFRHKATDETPAFPKQPLRRFINK